MKNPFRWGHMSIILKDFAMNAKKFLGLGPRPRQTIFDKIKK